MIWNYFALGSIMVRWSTHGDFRMRKLIIATTALAFLSSTAAFAQDKAAAPTGDSMSKSDMSKDKMSKKSKKSKKSSDDTTKQ